MLNSGFAKAVRPAGFVNAAVASSERPTKALPSASERAPGFRKLNSNGTCKLACAFAAMGTARSIAVNQMHFHSTKVEFVAPLSLGLAMESPPAQKQASESRVNS